MNDLKNEVENVDPVKERVLMKYHPAEIYEEEGTITETEPSKNVTLLKSSRNHNLQTRESIPIEEELEIENQKI